MSEATSRWSVRLDAADLHEATDGDSECIICLGEMEPNERLVRLPCSEPAAASSSSAEADGVGDHHAPPAPKAHIFHAECLSRWLLTSAACPTCRRAVRPMLREHQGRRGGRVRRPGAEA